MKKLLKSEVCGSREQRTEPIDVHYTLKKSQQLWLKKKRKKKRENAQTENADVNKLNPNRSFIPNNILTNFFKKLTKYKNDYQ